MAKTTQSKKAEKAAKKKETVKRRVSKPKTEDSLFADLEEQDQATAVAVEEAPIDEPVVEEPLIEEPEEEAVEAAPKGKKRKSDKSAGEAPAKRKKLPAPYATAETMAQRQREISVSEFFAKNRHLLGFDNPRKALLTTIKEAADNSLDACEEAGILPWIEVTAKQLAEDRFEVTVEDNGPGIVKQQIPNIFGKLLYGSKFHHLKMSRGQQGIGISAAGMYGLLTTGKPLRVTSRTSAKKPAHYYELQIDTQKNRPDIIKEEEVEFAQEHGTKVTIELEARYQRGRTSIDEYLRQTAIANPHVHLRYLTPDGELIEFKRTVEELPNQPKAIKPHPYGVELGVLIKMLHTTEEKTLSGFLTGDFSRVSPNVAQEIAKAAKLGVRSRPSQIGRGEADRLFQAIKQVKIKAPSTDCVVPIGEECLLASLQSVVKADFYAAATRPPAVYRGNPFIIEAALAYGKPVENANDGGPVEEEELELGKGDGQIEIGEEDESELIKLFRFANRVPLLYQQSACATHRATVQTNWRNYGLSQSRGALPTGPVVMIIHVASVWVPFTSESKEAVAHYPEIIKEIKLAIQDCGRKLARYLRREKRVRDELKKRSYIEKYIPHIGIALQQILGLTQPKTDKVVEELKDILEKSRTL